MVSHPISQEAEQNTRVTFSCAFQNVDGFDWKFNDVILADDADRSPLVINPVQPGDQGYYACVGYGTDGTEIETDAAVLTIKGRVVFPFFLFKTEIWMYTERQKKLITF